MNIIEDNEEIYTLLKSFIDKSEDAQEELDLFIANAVQNNDYNFSSGLIGAGWLLSYLYQQEIIKDDIDELLYDFDDNFYKIAIKTIVEDKSSLDDLLNIITYFQQRIQNKSSSYNFHRRFALFETIKLLAEKLVFKLAADELSIHDCIKCLFKLSYLTRTCVNEKDVEEVYYSKTEELIKYFSRVKFLSIQDEYNLRLLQLSCIQYDSFYWVNEIENIFVLKDECSKSELLIMMKNINNILFNDPEKKIDMSIYNTLEKENLLISLVTNLKRTDFFLNQN